MATRRVRSILNDEDVQVLKLGAPNNLVQNLDEEDHQILFSLARKPPVYNAHVWAKFDSTDFNGIHLMGYIIKNEKELIHAANCAFRVYDVVLTNTWTETLLYSTTGVQQADGRFIADITQANLGITDWIDGERTFAIEIELSRFKKKFKKKVYVNHLGVYDSIIRLRQEVEYLFLTKLDE